MRKVFVFCFYVVAALNLSAQQTSDKGLDAISVETVEAPLKFLASDYTEGREVGTKGAYMAADYIASVFQMYGIKPLGDMAQKRLSRELKLQGETAETYRSYFQNFDLICETRNKKSELLLTTNTGLSSQVKKLVEGVDFQLQGRFGSVELDAPLVFLGYGIKNDELKSDPFRQMDVKGKIAVILSGFPDAENPNAEVAQVLKKDAGFSSRKLEHEKIENARNAGAVAVLKYTPGQKFLAATPSNLPHFVDNEFYEGDSTQDDFYLKKISLPNWENAHSIPVIQINKTLAEELLSASGNLLEIMQAPDYKLSGFKAKDLDEFRMKFKIENDQKVIRGRNVLGYIEGENTDEVIVIGGHYDHVGKYNGFIFNGADDNASGTVGMLTLARAFKMSGKKPAKTIVFAAWTAEEQGLWGSKYFVKNIPDNMNVVLNINLDMIGRTSIQHDSESYLRFQYTESHPEFETIFENINSSYKLNLDIQYKPDEQPKGGSDFVPFAAEGIPVISLFTGLHRDYHFPNDEIESINLEKMTNIIRLAYLGLNDILEKQ